MEKAPLKRSRIFSIDIVRGLAMVMMALDHTRDYFSSAVYDPTNLAIADPAIFLTRWITHFCAPAFIFLAGTSAFLFKSRGRTKADLAFFLLTRGAWIIALEFTLVQWGWAFNFTYNTLVAQVMWAIGCSMIALAGLIFLPAWALLSISITMIAGHNLLDGITPESWGRFAWLWRILHAPGDISLSPTRSLHILYTLIPWIGVMALGYAIGPVFLREQKERRKTLLKLGFSMVLAFIVIRAFNIYGDPYKWTEGKNALYTFLSFIDYTKYPPSFLYLLATLGSTLIMLALFDRDNPGRARRFLLTYGRVPLFFYVLHIPLIHAIAVALAYIRYGYATWLFKYSVRYLDVALTPGAPKDYGYGLGVTYVVWISVVLALYPLCRWYAGVKKRNPQIRILSYL